MPAKFEDILVQCLDDIRAGRHSIEECLNRYPSLRNRLEPLLRIALEIQPPPDVEPSPDFKVRARVQLMEQIHAGRSVTKRPEPRYRNQTVLIPQRRRFSIIGVIVAIVLAVSAAGGGTAYASQDSLPGDVLYPVKLGTEQARMMLPADDVAKAERALGFAESRVAEMAALAEKGRTENLNLAQDKYDDVMNTVLARIEAARDKGLAIESISELVAEATAEQLSALDKVYENVPEQAKPAIERAREASMNGLGNALKALAGENPAKAMELNLAAMKERLNRVRAKAAEDDVEETGNALQRFEEMARFGEEISQIAQELGKDVTAVEELVAKATVIHLEVLAQVREQVPEPARAAIDRAIQESVRGYERAAEALEKIGAPGVIPPKPPIPEGVPAPNGIPPESEQEVPAGSDNETEVEEEEEEQEEQGEQQTPGPPSGIPGRP